MISAERRERLLSAVRLLHTAIFLVMAASILYILYCGLFGISSSLFVVANCLILIEGFVFLGNGAKCPLTVWAKSLGATKGYVFDTFFPERWTRYTFPVSTSLLVIGWILWFVRR